MDRLSPSAMQGTGRNSALLGVQWRFLSNDVARGEVVKDELSEAPFSDEAHRRITYLEKALVSQHDLDAQYQSFLQDAVQHAPGGSKWVSLSKNGAADVRARPRSELVDSEDHLLSDGPEAGVDQIPSDPIDAQPSDVLSGRGRGGGHVERRGPPSARLGGGGKAAGCGGGVSGGHADIEVARVQAAAAAAAAAASEAEAAADEPERNSPSPVIIWRHAAPVRARRFSGLKPSGLTSQTGRRLGTCPHLLSPRMAAAREQRSGRPDAGGAGAACLRRRGPQRQPAEKEQPRRGGFGATQGVAGERDLPGSPDLPLPTLCARDGSLRSPSDLTKSPALDLGLRKKRSSPAADRDAHGVRPPVVHAAGRGWRRGRGRMARGGRGRRGRRGAIFPAISSWINFR